MRLLILIENLNLKLNIAAINNTNQHKPTPYTKLSNFF